jgi:hypothetical protein
MAGAGAVLALTPYAAWAGGTPATGTGPSDVRVSPSQVHQGATLSVSASGCSGGGTVTSAAFPTVRLPAGTRTTATARVYNTAAVGPATLSVQCGGRSANASFTVIAGAASQGGLGGSQSPSTGEIAAGATMAGVAACAGVFFLARRRPSRGRL